MTPQPKINERCPSCGQQTLIIDNQGYFICSWIHCLQPDKLHLMIKPESLHLLPPVEPGIRMIRENQEEEPVERRGWEG